MTKHEAIISFKVGTELYNYYPVTVRRQSTGFSQGDNQDIYDAAKELSREVYMLNSSAAIKLIASRISALPLVSAVEVFIGPTRQGIAFSRHHSA